MIGLHGVRLHRLDRHGHVLADFDTPVSDTRPAPAKTFYGPYDPAISPDGKKVAYTYYYMTQSQSPTCFPPDVRDHDQRGRHRLLVGRPPDRLGRPGLGKHSGWRNPSWVDNDTVMISDPTHILNYDVILDTHQRRRLGQPRARLVQRHRRGQPAHRAAATSRVTAPSSRSSPARTTRR